MDRPVATDIEEWPLTHTPFKHVQIEMALVVAATGALTASVAVGIERVAGFPSVVPLLLLAVIGGLSLERIGTYHPHDRLGWANVVTFLRGGMICLFAGPLFAGRAMSEAEAWGAAGVALVALALDGVDGILARRQGLASRFGARLDMELDALFIMLLALLAWGNGKAGVWVLALGLMRYGFLAAGVVVARMRGDLPASMRRKVVCVVQVLVLIALLVPVVVPPVSSMLALAALAALVWSFAVDTAWLLRRVEA